VPYSTCFLTLQKHKYPGNFSQSFEQPNFKDINLSGSDFFKSTLKSVDFGEVTIQGADLRMGLWDFCSIKRSNFLGSDFYKTKFPSFIKIDQSNFINSNFSDTDLSYCSIYSSLFENARFENAILKGSRLIVSDFSATKLMNANLSESIIKDVNFNGANLEGADFSNVTFYNSSRFDNAYIQNVNFKNTDISKLDLSKSIGKPILK
jgi:uncharacterized protein YjbI with pentapeptide repeats